MKTFLKILRILVTAALGAAALLFLWMGLDDAELRFMLAVAAAAAFGIFAMWYFPSPAVRARNARRRAETEATHLHLTEEAWDARQREEAARQKQAALQWKAEQARREAAYRAGVDLTETPPVHTVEPVYYEEPDYDEDPEEPVEIPVWKKREQAEAAGLASCPYCGSTSLTANQKGFGVGKAVVGAWALGPIGLVAGNIGKNKITVTCLNCGRRFRPGR